MKSILKLMAPLVLVLSGVRLEARDYYSRMSLNIGGGTECQMSDIPGRVVVNTCSGFDTTVTEPNGRLWRLTSSGFNLNVLISDTLNEPKVAAPTFILAVSTGGVIGNGDPGYSQKLIPASSVGLLNISENSMGLVMFLKDNSFFLKQIWANGAISGIFQSPNPSPSPSPSPNR